MSFRNSSAPLSPPPPLFNQETLRQRLQALMKGARESWTYAIFWQSSYDHYGKSVLSWRDGYYKGDEEKGRGKSKVNSSATEQENRKKVLRELDSLISGTAPSAEDEEVTDTEWFFLVSMPQSFVNGSGLPGQAFFNSSPVWVAGAVRLAYSSCDRARQGQTFGLQTIVCIPSENGVVELGSTEVIFQSYDLLKRVTVLFNFSNMEAGSRPLDQGENDPWSFWISEPSRAVEVKDSANPRANTNQQTAFNKRLSNEQCSEAASSPDGAKAFDNAIGEGGFLTMAVNSTSVESHARGEKTITVAGSSLKDGAAESTGGLSFLDRLLSISVKETSHGTSRKNATVKGTGGKSNKRDWAWDYCNPIEGNSNGVKCMFCRLEIQGGGITRFKSHIYDDDPCKNVKKCKYVPPEYKVEIEKRTKGGYNKRK